MSVPACSSFVITEMFLSPKVRRSGLQGGMPVFSFPGPRNVKRFHSKYAAKLVPSHGWYVQPHISDRMNSQAMNKYGFGIN